MKPRRRVFAIILLGAAALMLLWWPVERAELAATTPAAAAAAASQVFTPDACLENRHLRFCVQAGDNRLRMQSIVNNQHGGAWEIASPLFVFVGWDGAQVSSDDCGAPRFENNPPILSAQFSCAGGLDVTWRAELPSPASTFVRLHLQWHSALSDLAPAMVLTIRTDSETEHFVRPLGDGFGAVVHHARKLIYFAAEHPRGANGRLEDDSPTVVAGLIHVPYVARGNVGALSTIIGTWSETSQRRREFQQTYLDVAARARTLKPFLHYNSWFDFSSWQEENQKLFANRTMTEANCLNRIDTIGAELVQKRGVQLDSFLWDDGWDDPTSLWNFHAGFPQGFAELKKRAATYGVGTGVWMSPWGGYGEAKDSRLEFGRSQGFETGDGGFLLSGPKYFARFRDTALSMVQNFGVNMFKLDGIGFAGNRTTLGTEMAAFLRLTDELRAKSEAPDLFLSLTTGTWPSPFWLLHGDAIWRGMVDLGSEGSGSPRQQWCTYRDAVVFHRVARASPLFPINSLMLHGIVLGAVGQARREGLDNIDSLPDFADEVWSYFATGVVLQELYISPDRMTAATWDVLATGAKWARGHSSTLVDSHWVGGDPVLAQVYGFAAWQSGFGLLTLRNPSHKPETITITLLAAWELPAAQKLTHYAFVCRYSRQCGANPQSPCEVPLDTTLVAVTEAVTFRLQAYEVLVLEGRQQASNS